MMTLLRPDKGDDMNQYVTAQWYRDGLDKPPVVILDRLSNGDCVYLGEGGCTIWDRAPYECRMYDCREMFKNSDRPGRKLAVKNGVVPKAIFDRGRELLGVDGV
jgi:Fe-S-cluster containining protein